MTAISGTTASAIVDSIRDLLSRGDLAPGDSLPPIRSLAGELSVNRNTVAAAYRQLVAAGVAQARGRHGTAIADLPNLDTEQIPASSLVDLASGNPDPKLLPNLIRSAVDAHYQPTLYGGPAIDPALMEVARGMFRADVGDADIVVTHGAVDAVERVLSAWLTRGDTVAVEDPCFLASIGTVRLNGYQRAPVPIDERGMTEVGLRNAIANRGARAVIITPRAHNPTGATIDARRATALRRVLADYPEVLVIEDDYLSMVSSAPYRRVTPPSTNNWALIRSVAKFLGPDLRLALTATNPVTAQRLSARLRAGQTWVSHLLQTTAAHMLSDPQSLSQLAHARTTYAERIALLTKLLAAKGIRVLGKPDGLNVWVDLPDAETVDSVVHRLARAGWAVQPGSIFTIDPYQPRHGVRITAAGITRASASAFAVELAKALAPNTAP